MISFYYYYYYFFLLLMFMLVKVCYGDDDIIGDTLFQGKQLKDGQSLSSQNNIFLLQFYSFEGSTNKYLAIMDNKQNRQAVWVANRNNPIPDASGSLEFDPNDGYLKIFHRGGVLPLPNSFPISIDSNMSATLLDSGNLVLRGRLNSTLWQSFDYPVDTFLPGMKLGINSKTGHNWSFTSWLGESLPATGVFTLSIDPVGKEQLIMFWRGSIYWTSGLLRNGRFDNMSPSFCYNFSYSSTKDEKYFMYSADCKDIDKAGLTLNYDGRILEQGKEIDYCVDAQAEGCVRQELPECRIRQGDFWFQPRKNHIFNGASHVFGENLNVNLFDCQANCLAHCSCVAFGSIAENGTGCEIWSEFSLKESNEPNKRILYTFQPGKAPKKKSRIWLISAIVGSTTLLLGALFYFVKRGKFTIKDNNHEGQEMRKPVMEGTDASSTEFIIGMDEGTICLFSLESLVNGTDNFSDAKKLGEGGFGSVYKGNLPNGEEVAIKRLSRKSGQGLVEFQNEVLLIAKLQHTNLVRLLGSCIQGQEMILVYEYMDNKSLDHFLFDPGRRGLLPWPIRVRIIQGIAQGLLYLHKYSRLKVIHRDLKASNVLLDHNMNPKISDFGMAKIFEAQESRANTNKIVGTHGYMAPEYVINGDVSLKTDIFSFGVLLLEIISGKKNRDCYDINRPLNLIGLAWELWTEGRAMELIDSTMDGYLAYECEFLKYMNIGLLCVQENPIDRPSMTNIVSMLINECVHILTPKQPAFYINANIGEGMSFKRVSLNDMSLSLMEGR